jgi:hypothetical protein
MRQIVESSGRLPVKGVPLVGVAKPCGEDLTSKSAVRYAYIVLIYYTMTDQSQVYRFIDVEAQVDNESETSEDGEGRSESYCDIVNVFMLI